MNIKSIIKRHGGYSGLARLVGVHRTTIYRWQAGKSPMPETAKRLLAELERRKE